MKLVEKKIPEVKANLVIEFTPDECEFLSVVMSRIGGVDLKTRTIEENLSKLFSENDYYWGNSKYDNVVTGSLTVDK